VLTPSSFQCLPLSQSYTHNILDTIPGVWRYDPFTNRDTLDICYIKDDVTRFQASYNFNGGNSGSDNTIGNGYFAGQVREDGRALQGLWYENGHVGIALMVLTAQSELHYIRWDHADIQAASFFMCDGTIGNTLWVNHRNVIFPHRANKLLNTTACARNANLGTIVNAGPFTPAGFVDEFSLQYEPLVVPKRPKRDLDGYEVNSANVFALSVAFLALIMIVLF